MQKTATEKREEALLAIDLWHESGLTQGAFCRQEGIARSTFQHWRRRYDSSYEHQGKRDKKPTPSKKVKERFIALEPEKTEEVLPVEFDVLEIIYKNDVRVKCSSSISVVDLQKLIRLEIP